MAELTFRAPGINYRAVGPGAYVEIQGKYLCVVNDELALQDKPPVPEPAPAPPPVVEGAEADVEPEAS